MCAQVRKCSLHKLMAARAHQSSQLMQYFAALRILESTTFCELWYMNSYMSRIGVRIGVSRLQCGHQIHQTLFVGSMDGKFLGTGTMVGTCRRFVTWILTRSSAKPVQLFTNKSQEISSN
jgi:hypothetical protein